MVRFLPPCSARCETCSRDAGEVRGAHASHAGVPRGRGIVVRSVSGVRSATIRGGPATLRRTRVLRRKQRAEQGVGSFLHEQSCSSAIEAGWGWLGRSDQPTPTAARSRSLLSKMTQAQPVEKIDSTSNGVIRAGPQPLPIIRMKRQWTGHGTRINHTSGRGNHRGTQSPASKRKRLTPTQDETPSRQNHTTTFQE